MLERITKFIPAYDLRRDNPSENYGIHNMVLQFAVKGAEGAVDISISTEWHLPHVARELLNAPYYHPRLMPWFTNVGYHSRKPIFDYHNEEPSTSHCCLTDGPCWSDGTSLWGDEAWREGFLNGGSDWLWPRLEAYYAHIFYGGPLPDLSWTPVPHPKDRPNA